MKSLYLIGIVLIFIYFFIGSYLYFYILNKKIVNKKIPLLITVMIVLMIIAINILGTILEYYQFDPEVSAAIISGIFGFITLIGTVITISITWISNKNKNLIEVVTKNRAEWVKEMKSLFSEYLSVYDNKKIYLNLVRNNDDLEKIRNKISLRLNPNGVIDNEVLEYLDELIKKRDTNLRNMLEIKIKLYLKCEWERIKFETKGRLKEYDFEYEFEKIQLINHIENDKVSVEEMKKILENNKKDFSKKDIANEIIKKLNKEPIISKSIKNKIKEDIVNDIKKDTVISINKAIEKSKE
ncbi:MFS transporter [Clostridium baratii]|uniref:MFS transporter n=1 Tax=Clostridium baratii TaxID=1561 RepID=UPI001C24BAA9|nr:MFS transporter [Clostridium baratii]